MFDIWAPVIAALGSGGITFGISYWQSKKEEKTKRFERKQKAYANMLLQSFRLLFIANSLYHGKNLKPNKNANYDAFDLLSQMDTYSSPLCEALSEVWMFGSQKAIKQANILQRCCQKAIESATKDNAAQSIEISLRDLGRERKNFCNIVRNEIGNKSVDLLLGF